uniref:PilS cassette n=1 Tax=Ascaris lumbricoides TaxID=6252 RepID=A0A0M3I530_ASCLU
MVPSWERDNTEGISFGGISRISRYINSSFERDLTEL